MLVRDHFSVQLTGGAISTSGIDGQLYEEAPLTWAAHQTGQPLNFETNHLGEEGPGIDIIKHPAGRRRRRTRCPSVSKLAGWFFGAVAGGEDAGGWRCPRVVEVPLVDPWCSWRNGAPRCSSSWNRRPLEVVSVRNLQDLLTNGRENRFYVSKIKLQFYVNQYVATLETRIWNPIETT